MFNSYSEMVQSLAKPGTEILFTLTPESMHILHMAVGLSGEVGELVETLQPPTPFTESIVEELGDIEYYLEGLKAAAKTNTSISSSPATESFSPDLLVISAANTLDTAKRIAIYNQPDKLLALAGTLIEFEHELLSAYLHLRLDRDYVRQQNMKKLEARYAGGTYSDAAARERADKPKVQEDPGLD